MLISTASKFVPFAEGLTSSSPQRESDVSTLDFSLRNSGAIYFTFVEWQIATHTSICLTPRGTSVQMLLASQVIRFTLLLEKPLHVQKFIDLLGRVLISRSKGLHSPNSLLVPRKLAVTTLKLHQCDNSFLADITTNFRAAQARYPCTITRGKLACSDGVRQAPGSIGICYSKTNQRDEREYAVTWLQQ